MLRNKRKNILLLLKRRLKFRYINIYKNPFLEKRSDLTSSQLFVCRCIKMRDLSNSLNHRY